MFFCIHAIFYFELIEDLQDSFLIHENVYFLSAPNAAAAKAQAEPGHSGCDAALGERV